MWYVQDKVRNCEHIRRYNSVLALMLAIVVRFDQKNAHNTSHCKYTRRSVGDISAND